MQEEIDLEGVEVTIEQIDKKSNSNKPVIRTEKEELNLKEHLVDAIHRCEDIMQDIENNFGKTVLHDKVFTDGGAEKFLNIVGEKVVDNIRVPVEGRYYSNAFGYLLV